MKLDDSVALEAVAERESLVVDGATRLFGTAVALRAVSLKVRPGEIVSVTGPSGAGKTTLARIISGLECLDAGEIRCRGGRFDRIAARHRRVAHMFESYALYPHRTVAENIASPLLALPAAERPSREGIRERVDELLALTEMTVLADRLPGALSGGQKQRVALCRALVQKPSVLLLDEPLAHLDAKLRHRLRREIRLRLKSGNAPAIWFTPDATEALAVGDRVVVLIDGEVRQDGTPEQIHLQPADIGVARLLGDPPMNLLDATLVDQIGVMTARHAAGTVTLPQRMRGATEFLPASGRCVLGLRPAAFDVLPTSTATDGLAGEIYTTEPMGKHMVVSVRVGADLVRAKVEPGSAWRPGDRVVLRADPARVLVFSAESGRTVDPGSHP
ncbi:MAG: ABC transporter ATP-binding protein [Burkholderiales bacterium]|nr:ABC transporter ATP-binding protein [Burkholderiales bacterium]